MTAGQRKSFTPTVPPRHAYSEDRLTPPERFSASELHTLCGQRAAQAYQQEHENND